MNRRRICYILMASLIFSSFLVSVMNKPLSTFGDANQQEELFKSSVIVDQTTRIQHVPKPASNDSTQGDERIKNGNKERLIGSRPPRCEHKCGGCIPCVPIQIPSNKHLLPLQYSNYQPQSWKCKCANSYFNP